VRSIWPRSGGRVSRARKLLLRLVDVGSVALEHDQQREANVHRAAVTASSGKYADAFGPDYLAKLRAD